MTEEKKFWANPEDETAEEERPKMAPTVSVSARERLYRLHHELTNDAKMLMELKNHDYASREDPYRNFRLFGRFGILVRLGDKFARLRSFEEQGELLVTDESIRDTLLDIINYVVLYYGYEE